MMPKDASAASSLSCDYEDISIKRELSLGKWWTAPPLTRASYDFTVDVFGIYQECFWDIQKQEDEGTPIVMRALNNVSGSLLDDPVLWSFAYRHWYYDNSTFEMKQTDWVFVQYQGTYNLCKFNPVVPSFILENFDYYDHSELYCGAKDANNHVVRKYFDFICVNKGTESDYTSAILGVGDKLDDLNSDFQTTDVSVDIDEPSYIVEFREAYWQDSEPSYIMPDPCPDVFLLEEVYNAFMPSEIAIFSGSALLLLLCGWWLRQ